MASYDAEWWVKRIAIISGALTVAGIIWRPVTRWFRDRFDAKVVEVLRRCKIEVKTVMRDEVFPAEFVRAAETRALAEANQDRLEAFEAVQKAQGIALLDIPRLAGEMKGLPAAIQDLTKTMMAIHREVGEIRGQMRSWDGTTERRNAARDDRRNEKDGDKSSS